MEVQCGRMDLDGWVEPGQPEGHVRDSGYGCRVQRSWGANGAVSWTDAAGNFWLFGGDGFDSAGTDGYLNDLWKYSAGEWTWMSGSNVVNQMGHTGLRVRLPRCNIPGARAGCCYLDRRSRKFLALRWLWLRLSGEAGKTQRPMEAQRGRVDLDGWVERGQPGGTYGTQGTAAAGNIPGARSWSSSWTDAAGNFWLFGGSGYSSDLSGSLNDLWKYSAGEWTWMGGSNGVSQDGTYGTQGTAAASNIPGARAESISWTDAAGNLWLFGGDGYGVGTYGYLNDLWKYEP